MTGQSAKTLVICVTTDDGPFLLEWLAYWRSIGADDFLIYSHACTDGSDALLEHLAKIGLIHHAPLNAEHKRPARVAMGLAPSHPAYAKADWIIAALPSDFLNIRQGRGQIADLIGDYGAADGISARIRRFDTTQRARDDLSLAMYDMAEPEAETRRRRQRTLFCRASAPDAMTLRAPRWGGADGKDRTIALAPNIAQVNQYPDRLAHAPSSQTAWQRDLTIQRHLDGVVDILAELRSDPETLRLHEATATCHFGKAAPPPVASPILADPLLHPEVAEIKAKAPLRYANRRRMLESLPRGGRCAEIGVWGGAFTLEILSVTQPEELVLIDPWEMIADAPETTWTHRRMRDRAFMAEKYAEVVALFAHLPNVTIRKGFSESVLASYPDDYFDWVYIDGNHLYEFVKRDVELSLRKVRPGGIIAGDDFTWEKDGRAHVRDAVLDALRDKGHKDAPQMMGQQYLITVDG